jgi:GxxExxY protein
MDRRHIAKRWEWEDDPLTHLIIGAAIEVHRQLGPGCLESTYEECLCLELAVLGIPFVRQVPLPIVYKSTKILRAYKPDLLVDGAVIVELKTIDKILTVHEAQLLTYLRLSGLERGLLINFNSVQLTQGIRRLNKSIPSSISPISPMSPLPEELASAKPDQPG